MTITKDTVIGDILKIAPQAAPLFMGIGMHCLGCPTALPAGGRLFLSLQRRAFVLK